MCYVRQGICFKIEYEEESKEVDRKEREDSVSSSCEGNVNSVRRTECYAGWWSLNEWSQNLWTINRFAVHIN